MSADVLLCLAKNSIRNTNVKMYSHLRKMDFSATCAKGEPSGTMI